MDLDVFTPAVSNKSYSNAKAMMKRIQFEEPSETVLRHALFIQV